jgi:succinoglycan biosynthesis protein ExoM
VTAELTVDVLLCTFRRPEVAATLASLDAQALPPGVHLRILVADNDDTPSARDPVRAAAARVRHPVTYLHAPARNISVARNALLDAASADLVAFIDDDETASRDWLARLIAGLGKTGADAVFGPSVAIYGAGAPAWMRRADPHSNIPVHRAGLVETGHTCNGLLRWSGSPWQQERFDPRRGRSGGEDTEFFFRLRQRHGARLAIVEDALVFEPVAVGRLTLSWLRKRRFRMGRSYACGALGGPARLRLGAAAAAKAAVCLGAAGLRWPDRGARLSWLLRGVLHAGVCTGCLLPHGGPALYGDEGRG